MRPCGLRDLSLARLPLGEATGATQRNEEERVFSSVFWVFFYLEVPKQINPKFPTVDKPLLNGSDAAGGQNRLLVLLGTTFR